MARLGRGTCFWRAQVRRMPGSPWGLAWPSASPTPPRPVGFLRGMGGQVGAIIRKQTRFLQSVTQEVIPTPPRAVRTPPTGPRPAAPAQVPSTQPDSAPAAEAGSLALGAQCREVGGSGALTLSSPLPQPLNIAGRSSRTPHSSTHPGVLGASRVVPGQTEGLPTGPGAGTGTRLCVGSPCTCRVWALPVPHCPSPWAAILI